MSETGVAMRKIILEEARAKGAPAGPAVHGYEVVAPLDGAGFINLDAWRKERARCFVHRLERGRIVERGLLVHRPGGAGGANWAFDYEAGTMEDEEVGWRFADHAFKPGEYVSVRDDDGELRTFRVSAVAPA
jgi:hypothetical protein